MSGEEEARFDPSSLSLALVLYSIVPLDFTYRSVGSLPGLGTAIMTNPLSPFHVPTNCSNGPNENVGAVVAVVVVVAVAVVGGAAAAAAAAVAGTVIPPAVAAMAEKAATRPGIL